MDTELDMPEVKAAAAIDVSLFGEFAQRKGIMLTIEQLTLLNMFARYQIVMELLSEEL